MHLGFGGDPTTLSITTLDIYYTDELPIGPGVISAILHAQLIKSISLLLFKVVEPGTKDSGRANTPYTTRILEGAPLNKEAWQCTSVI